MITMIEKGDLIPVSFSTSEKERKEEGKKKMLTTLSEERKSIGIEGLEALLKNSPIPPKKILLIDGNRSNFGKSPTQYVMHTEDDLAGTTSFVNFGIQRLEGYLTHHNLPVQTTKLPQNPLEDRHFLCQVEEGDIIGISTLSTAIQDSFELCKAIKERYPEKLIVWGAEHFALDYERILQHPESTGCDVCCTSQWELPLLALSLGVPVEQIGSIAYREGKNIHKNKNFPRLHNSAENEIVQPSPATPLEMIYSPMVMPERKKYFKYAGNTQTQSGCLYACDFCTNHSFLWGGVLSTLETAKQEIRDIYRNKNLNFFYVRDTMLNTTVSHFNDFLNFMTKEINTPEHKKEKELSRFSFMAVRKEPELRRFAEMAEAWCKMIGVGIEDVIGRREDIKKGNSLQTAIDFIEEAKEYVVIRALLILGLPVHYQYSREEIKWTLLNFMKTYPQTLYRINLRTPIVGTPDFKKYAEVLARDVRNDVEGFSDHDTGQSVIDPQKMYNTLNMPPEKRRIEDKADWDTLRTEIMKEYFASEEYKTFLLHMEQHNTIFADVMKEYHRMWIEG